MTKYLITIIIIILAFSVNAQDKTPNDKNRIINSYTTEIQLGNGGGYIGIMGRANHWWIEKGKFKLQSGVSLSMFYGSEKMDAGTSQIYGYTFDTHIQLHTGIEQSIFNKERIYVFLDMYGGAYNIIINGNLKNSEMGIDRESKNSEFLLDYGSRLGFGYRVKEKWGIHLSMTNSWRNVSSHGAIGLILGQPDAKYNIGLGLNYRLN